MYKIGLNLNKSGNYMYFDFDAPLCLSVEKNVGVVERLTPNILSAIKSETLIMLKDTTSKEKEEVVETKEEVVKKDATEKIIEEVTEDVKAVEEEIVEEEIVEEKPKKAPTKRAPKKAKAE